jgi:hypothetical protein
VKKVLQYDSFQVQRWPSEKYISDDANPSTIHPHPRGKQGLGGSEWQGQLLFAGSECSQKGGSGLMNGAVLAANDMLEKLYQPQTTTAS